MLKTMLPLNLSTRKLNQRVILLQHRLLWHVQELQQTQVTFSRLDARVVQAVVAVVVVVAVAMFLVLAAVVSPMEGTTPFPSLRFDARTLVFHRRIWGA
jgi:hypothetical protein